MHPASTPSSANTAPSNPAHTLRLVALWGLSEAFLGGILHALKLPLTGLLVGGASLTLIVLLGQAGRRGTVLRGLLVVLSIKALLSPQSPPTAYLAVAFQGVLGEVLAGSGAWPRLRGAVLGAVTMLESAGQQLFVLWLLYQKPLAVAFNAFLDKLLGAAPAGAARPDYALGLAAAWLGGHLLAGAALGWWAGGLPARLPQMAAAHPEWQVGATAPAAALAPAAAPAAGRGRLSRVLLAIWLALALAWLGQRLGWWGAGPLGEKGLAGLLLRSVLIYGAWALVLAPWLLRRLRGYLSRPRPGRWATDLAAALALLPDARQLVAACWTRTAHRRGLARLRLMVQMLAVNVVGR